MDESISFSSIIDKLPPSWKDFKHTLKHGKDDLPLVQLSSHLHIEESLRAQDIDKGKGKEVDAIAWWIDFGATTPVCKDRCWFKTYKSVEDGSVLYMGDDNFALVHGKGSVVLEFSSGKSITLFNVLYVPKLCKNLIFGHVLNKCGYKQVYESDKYILSKCGVFLGFDYYNNGMFTLNLNEVSDDSDSVYMSSSSSNVVSSSLWHARLGHVHYKRMLEMSKDDLILAIDENPQKCTTFVRLRDPKRKTLGEKGDCIFVGYAEHSKTYRSKDIIPNSVESQMDDHSDDVPSEIPKPHKGKRVQKAKSYGSDFQLYLVEGSRDHVGSQYSYCYSIKEDPRTYDEAMQSQDIFKRKMKVGGTIDKFKTRLVIQGFRQKEGIDYFDTYAPVSRITTIRLLLSLVAIHNLVIHQMDVKKSFLNGDLDEEVYMKQSGGFVMPGIVITQSHFIKKILKKFNREDCSPVSTPIDLVEKLKSNTGKRIDQLEYSRAIGCLMYAMTSTRLDIAYVVDKLSRFTSNPNRQHVKAITRVFKHSYLGEVPFHGLPRSKHASLVRAYSQVYNRKSRHLGVRHSMVRELIKNGVSSIEFVRTQHNLADHLTKGVTPPNLVGIVILNIRGRYFIYQ
nr:zinc finger, CCHC-type [Tanacetum cinerariifolium]